MHEAIERAEASGAPAQHDIVALVLIDQTNGQRRSYTLADCYAELSNANAVMN